MKKAVTILFILTFPAYVFSQASFGVKIGGGYHWISGIKSSYDVGYEGGFFSKAELGKKISLLAELDYADKKSEVTIQDTSHTLELNFATVRFSLTYDFNDHFFAGAGPSFSYMIEAKQSPELVPSSYFTHFAVGIDPFAGFETPRFLFLLRYEAGLTVLTLEDTPEAKGNSLTGAHFNGIKLIAGVKF